MSSYWLVSLLFSVDGVAWLSPSCLLYVIFICLLKLFPPRPRASFLPPSTQNSNKSNPGLLRFLFCRRHHRYCDVRRSNCRRQHFPKTLRRPRLTGQNHVLNSLAGGCLLPRLWRLLAFQRLLLLRSFTLQPLQQQR